MVAIKNGRAWTEGAFKPILLFLERLPQNAQKTNCAGDSITRLPAQFSVALKFATRDKAVDAKKRYKQTSATTSPTYHCFYFPPCSQAKLRQDTSVVSPAQEKSNSWPRIAVSTST